MEKKLEMRLESSLSIGKGVEIKNPSPVWLNSYAKKNDINLQKAFGEWKENISFGVELIIEVLPKNGRSIPVLKIIPYVFGSDEVASYGEGAIAVIPFEVTFSELLKEIDFDEAFGSVNIFNCTPEQYGIFLKKELSRLDREYDSDVKTELSSSEWQDFFVIKRGDDEVEIHPGTQEWEEVSKFFELKGS